MKHILATSTAALFFMSTAAFAQPTVMSDEQLDSVVAGQTLVVNKAGKTIWTVTELTLNGTTVTSIDGVNRGGKGNTARTAFGLLKAAGDPLNLGLPGNGMGLSVQ
mgnify:CR=1 FL=1